MTGKTFVLVVLTFVVISLFIAAISRLFALDDEQSQWLSTAVACVIVLAFILYRRWRDG
jgi:hypothetical protein